ncbi:MAG TPA: methyl-accepting chemotaxis protein [Symbiobacteriaceae bacterium]|jgi:methyl-accepting chemotaxis protein
MGIAPFNLSILRSIGRKATTSSVTPENPSSDKHAPQDARLTVNKAAAPLQQIGRSASAVLDTLQESETAVQEVTQVAELVGDAISKLSQDLCAQVERTEETGRVVAELATTIQQISTGAQDQANSAQQMSERVDQVAARLENVVAKAGRVVVSAKQASAAAKDGGAVVLRAADKMRQIRGTVLDSAQRIEQLSQKGKHIGSINQTITRIAQQTNLLALNAAIEAARAGEHGRGFAVVADEVRKLATGAANAAREINELLQQIQSDVATVVEVMERGRAEVEDGVAFANDAGNALQAILREAEETATDADAISSAATDIGQASHELVDSVTLMAAIAEENMAATEQMHAGAESVRTTARDVSTIVQRNTEAGQDMYAAMEIIHGVADQLTILNGQTVTRVSELSQQVNSLLSTENR